MQLKISLWAAGSNRQHCCGVQYLIVNCYTAGLGKRVCRAGWELGKIH